MIFSTFEFIFLFLPLAVIGYYLAGRRSNEVAIVWLVACSLFFYSWWDVRYLPLILGSMTFNFIVGKALSENRLMRNIRSRTILIFGISANLLLLGIFKYLDFFLSNINFATGTQLELVGLVLPLAISFFTFQQIAYLVDSYRGEAKEYSFSHYALFVTFFPQLIAGPIVHHKEMLPQFSKSCPQRRRTTNLVTGITVFLIGWFKKSVIADGIAPYSNIIFEAALTGNPVSFFDAWGGALAYTFQLYFDFSGYADMAIGAALCFNIRLPINFYSPYKALSIVDFWRRWHITLSRFLRDYIYIPLGGNRRGKVRRYSNLLITMLLGGIWHGAGWTFIFWGVLHGTYLVINSGWSSLVEKSDKLQAVVKTFAYKITAWLLTFLCVVIGWVYFRAESFDAANNILLGMSGVHGVIVPESFARAIPSLYSLGDYFGVEFKSGIGADFVMNYLWVACGLFISLVMPNTQQLLRLRWINHKPFEASSWSLSILWRPSLVWAMVMSIVATFATLSLTQVSEFLYFQF